MCVLVFIDSVLVMYDIKPKKKNAKTDFKAIKMLNGISVHFECMCMCTCMFY